MVVVAWVVEHWKLLLKAALIVGVFCVGCDVRGRVDKAKTLKLEEKIIAEAARADACLSDQDGYRNDIAVITDLNRQQAATITAITTARSEAERRVYELERNVVKVQGDNARLLVELDSRPLADACEDAVWEVAEQLAALEAGGGQ